jgi:acyl CoA:acetate/3-ketoacid CoA transferase alpha subunit/acyl CoA:acetate/3-ketoacid CoA transferase beta subunit
MKSIEFFRSFDAVRAGPDKTMTLQEAVRRFVRPGMTIHVGNSHAMPMAALYEIVKQYWDRKPGFVLAMAAANCINAAPFVYGNLCQRLVTSFAGDGYPYPGPNPILQRAYAQRSVEIEEWTMLTLTLRLLAGALDLPFMPTHSLAKSGLSSSGSSFATLTSPFSEGTPIGVVKALKPDISLAHGAAADSHGNVLLTPPFAAGAWGALAAREGVLATVEKIVDAEFICKHSYLVKIPSHRVLAICEAPFGAHPGGQQNLGVPEIIGYAEDRQFILQARSACQESEAFTRWIAEWILGCADHSGYLQKLGSERLRHLQARIQPESWRRELEETDEDREEYTLVERMIVAAARRITQLVEQKKYRVILAGIGASHLAAWLAYYQLLAKGIGVELMAEMGPVGYAPLPGDPFAFNVRNAPTATMNTDMLTVLGALTGRECLGVLGAAQIDKHGNINSSQISDKSLWLVGSGGANDVAATAGEVIVVAEQSPTRFVDRVSYVTASGERVSTVVSSWGVYEKQDGELVLNGHYGDPAESRSHCGWSLQVSDQLGKIAKPTLEELKILRAFDPQRFFLGSLRDPRVKV